MFLLLIVPVLSSQTELIMDAVHKQKSLQFKKTMDVSFPLLLFLKSCAIWTYSYLNNISLMLFINAVIFFLVVLLSFFFMPWKY